MDLRLAYRIASMKPMLPSVENIDVPVTDSLREALSGRLSMEKRMVATSQKLVFDNVARFFHEHDQQMWSAIDDIPNAAPPFQQFFVEWNEPKQLPVNERVTSRKHDSQIGLNVLAFDVTEENKSDKEQWDRFFALLAGYEDTSAFSTFYQYVPKSRWVLFASLWMTTSESPICGAPIWGGIYIFLFVDGNGRIVNWNATGLTAKFQQQNDPDMSGINSAVCILGLGLSFMHCKNVSQKDETDDRGRRWHRQTKVPAFKFKTLQIDPMRETLRGEGGSDGNGIKKALHICRGHFATYSVEKPLFGKFVGTFWKPDHVRGQSSEGVVEKEYSVNAPS